MSKYLVVACLFFAAGLELAQSQQPCAGYFGKEDQQIIASPQIADFVVFRKIIQGIFTSGYTPDVKDKMIDCAYQRHEEASKGSNQMREAMLTATVPQYFAPSVSQSPIPMIPMTAPQVVPMQNAAPNQLLQTGQTLMNLSQQLLLMGSLMDAKPQNLAAPKKMSVFRYTTKHSAEIAFDETVRIISAEKYEIREADKSKETIQAVGMGWGSEKVSAAVLVSIQSTGAGACLQVIIAKYPGFVGGRSPKTLAASFEKDLRKIEPDLIAEQ